MTRWTVEPIYDSLLATLLVAVAVVAAMWWVTPPTPNRSQRRWLIGLRCLAAAALLLVAAGPSLIRTDTEPGEATLVVAVDTSRSMTLSDGDGSDRWSTQAESWRRLADGLLGRDDHLAVSLMTYDRSASEIAGPSAGSLAGREPEGDVTDLGAALSAALQRSAGRPLAGVVLMGDGTQTAGREGTDARRVVETLDSMGVPLWTVPIGPASDVTQARDVAVESLPETLQLFAGNEFEVPFEVDLRGLAGNEVPVRLSWVDASGSSRPAASRPAVADQADQTVPLSVPLRAPDPGVYRLVVEAERQPGELIAENNRQVCFVEVREGGGRVLYLEGTPRLEQLFLRRALLGFPDLDLTYQWIPADTSDRWPADLQGWLQPGEFDVILIGDLDATAIGSRQLEQLAETVGEGAGLAMLGGFQTFGAGGYADSPLAEVLPVRMDPGRRRPPGVDRGDADDQLEGPLEIIPVRDHPVVDLGGDDLRESWAQLPPLAGATRLLGPKAAPGVQVLLESESEVPLLVVGEYGRGRTAAVAFDSTYRWWRAGQQDVHRRFWRQLILWLLAREGARGEMIQVELEDRRFGGDAQPSFTAGVQSLESETPADLQAEVVADSGAVTPVPVSTRAADERWNAAIGGTLPELEPGFYRLRVSDRRPGSELQPAELAFQVIEDSRELAQPLADTVYLRQLAAMTDDHGGAAFSPDEIDRLVAQIAERRERAETTVVARYRLGDGPISGWLLFAIFLAALTTEWWLRRRWGLA